MYGSRLMQRAATLALLCAVALTGCAQERLVQPVMLKAPYEREQVWAVAPFANESGTLLVDTARIADAFAYQIQEAHGLNSIPVNRVIAAMRQLEMPAVQSQADAAALLNLLGVDGLIVGTVTAYNPYRPMTLGAAIELHASASDRAAGAFDTRTLSRSASDSFSPGGFASQTLRAQAAGIFDASNHETLAWLNSYAQGRSEPRSAYGKDIYLVRMDMYAQFVSFKLLHELLKNEQMRLSPIVQESPRR